jgi:hypothetical protein
MAPAARFISSDGNGRGNYLMWRYHFFFLILFLFSFPKRQQNEVLTRNSNGRTEGTDPGVCIGQKRLPCQIDESCTALVGTSIPPQKKKKEEGGSKFKCNYSGHGKTPRQVLRVECRREKELNDFRVSLPIRNFFFPSRMEL